MGLRILITVDGRGVTECAGFALGATAEKR